MDSASFTEGEKTETDETLDPNQIDLVKRKQSSKTSKQVTDQHQRILGFKASKGFKKIKKITDSYQLGKELGSGSFGSVRLAQHKASKVMVAIKIIKKQLLRESEIYQELMRNELQVLEAADHPNITRVFELMEDDKSFFIVMEYCSGGNLLDKLLKQQKMTERVAADITQQILLALNYMHKQKMMHRDLKPENMLVQDLADTLKVNVKLTDFGFATTWKAGEKLDLSLGSPLYMAPELVNELAYDNRVDVWSVGVIVYILLSGAPPFVGQDKEQIYEAIVSAPLNFGNKFARVSNEAKDFIRLCLQKDYSKRPQINALLQHPWLKIVETWTPEQNVLLDIGKSLFEF